jgi:hypothetical protein
MAEFATDELPGNDDKRDEDGDFNNDLLGSVEP